MRTPIALLLLAFAMSASAQIYDNWIYNLDGTTTGHWYYNGDAGGRERLLSVGDHRETSIASPTLTTFKAAMIFGTNGRRSSMRFLTFATTTAPMPIFGRFCGYRRP